MKKILNYSLFLLILLSFSCSNDDKVLEETKPFHEVVIGSLNEALNFTILPDNMITNTNQTSKEAVVAFNDIVKTTSQIVDFLKVPKTTISSTITDKKESFNWLDNLFGDVVEVNYAVEKQLDRFSFVYNVSSGNLSLDFLKGNTLLDENAGVFIINEGSAIGALNWEITDENIIIELLFEDKTTLVYNKSDRSGTITSEEVIYKWNKDGKGSFTDNSTNIPVVKTW
ncbi:hypothetical protein [Tenacibaculum jejuense]|uniref:Probable lipoprotein n=1 Tax=Tenacibaculum jejuense TaxID=584609 RepID=A0A238UFA8_9FLAO|nr:hypothetical protein [Tenacibaculum jejuense]SNR17676.1 Probable lipoprotein precursor [Tenacibaculum jejuense]